MAEHERFGGVVPEIASRAHLEAMVPTVHRALADAGVRAADVDAVAVTSGPGLTGALLVGVAAAKAYALALDKPLYGVNHLAAHVAVDELQHGRLAEPSIALLVSGGHSSLWRTGSRAGPRSGRSRCWSRVGTAGCCWFGTSPVTWSRWGGRSTTRRGRPSTRWPASWACRFPAARRSTRRPATATPTRSPSLAGSPARGTRLTTSRSPA